MFVDSKMSQFGHEFDLTLQPDRTLVSDTWFHGSVDRPPLSAVAS